MTLFAVLLIFGFVEKVCGVAPLRLRGPSSKNGVGRVEVFYNGQWGTICDDSWDTDDANVVCRQLGYASAVRALAGSSTPDGTGEIWLDDVSCSGSEQYLSSCSHAGWGIENCNHEEDAGVECAASPCVPIRLQGPNSGRGVGRVEVFYSGQWGTVCDDSWDMNDARVVCRFLGYEYTIKALQGSDVPDGTGQIWLDNVECSGRELSLSHCSHAGWGVENCGHGEDAGVICSSTRDINECALSLDNCHSNAYCSNTVGSFRCTCRTGYSGSGTSCRDINECSLSGSCHPKASCTNTGGSFRCTCHSGYTNRGRTSCQDINECARSLDNCHSNALCTNTDGSYTCTCRSGYTGSGTNCQDINECALSLDNCHSNARCINTRGSFRCTCKTGYSGSGTNCRDINECARCLNNCHSNAHCTNTDGSYSCTCRSGYSGSGTNCQDINECSLSSGSCHPKASCTNTDGSFRCTCHSGYTKRGTACQDINECALSVDNCHSNARCTNTDGSFRCTCRSGYSGSGTVCQDINECSRSIDNCHSNAKCVNTDGSFLCICDNGYTGNGTVCQDIDECSLSINNCYPNSTCTNIDGSFLCICGNADICQVAPLRLQGPLSKNGTGRVEVFYKGEWGTVCDDSWDIDDANVVCRQLGYTCAVKAFQGEDVPDGTGQIWLDDVRCAGSEQNLTSCFHAGWGNENCDHGQNAGVECSSTDKKSGGTCDSMAERLPDGSHGCNCKVGYSGNRTLCADVLLTLGFSNRSNVEVQEGNSLVLTIEVTGPLITEISATVTVLLASTSEADFDTTFPLPGLNFSPGNTNETITIATKDDTIIEPNEVFVITLSTTNLNVQIDKMKGVAVITINDNDKAPESVSSRSKNIDFVIGIVVSAMVILITVILLVACFLYRRMPKRKNERDILVPDNIQNAAYLYRDTQPDENAQQSSCMGGQNNANNQCLKTNDQSQPDHYENAQRYALLNVRGGNNSDNEVFEEHVYEEMRRL